MQQLPASVLDAGKVQHLNQVPGKQFAFCAAGTSSDAGR